MVRNVINPVVTVATGNRVITWTEVVHLDVTLVFMAISVTLVVQFIYRIYLTFFNVVSNGSILLPLNHHIGIKNFCGIVFHSPPMYTKNVLYKDLFIKDIDENICLFIVLNTD